MSVNERAQKSSRAIELLAALPEYRSVSSVLLFASLPDEVDTFPLIRRALKEGKLVVLPRCEMATHALRLCVIRSIERDLAPGTRNILEPTGEQTVPPSQIELAVIPARAFDERGNRLGRGAGFYDRLLADPAFRATRCGLAFEEQILAELPHDAHDQTVQIVVTDRRVRRV